MNYLNKILKKAEVEHDKLKHPYVGTEHLLLALLSEDNNLTVKLKEYNLTYNKFKKRLKEIVGEGSKKAEYILYTPMLRKVINSCDEEEDNINNESLFKSLIKTNEGIAIRILESMNIDICLIDVDSNNELNINDYKIEHRENEIKEIIQILMRKNKCNPLLIGNAGVGKTAIVEELQRRINLNEVPAFLKEYKIINVDMSSLVAGTKYRGDFESKINNLLSNIKGKKKILFIDEIHTLVHAGGAEGAISAGDIIKPYLSRGDIKCIGATTVNEYHEYFKCDEALNRRFQTIYINETSQEETLDILYKVKESYENFHEIKIEESILREIVDFSKRYINNKSNPDKSIELLDSCCTDARFNNEEVVTIKNLYHIILNRYGIDLNNNEIKSVINEKKILLTNSENINKIKTINNRIIFIDGNNYKNEEDLYNLLGNPYYKNNYYLLKEVIEKPLGIIVLTNCNYNIILKEIINKIVDARRLIDNYGNNIYFDNYIIIMEKEINDDVIGFNSDNDDNKSYIEYNDKLLIST